MKTSPSLLDDVDAVLTAWCAERDVASYRVRQIRQWILSRGASDYDQMTDLPAQLRRQLADDLPLFTSRIVRHTTANDGTEKLLLQMARGGQIECVLLRDRVRRTVCISTQVGCGMGCVFCASGLDGVERNLTTGEIIEQVLRLRHLLSDDERLSHIVVMGMGEPLANLDALLPALATLSSADALDISHRRITISTVGLPKAIRRLAEIDAPYRLAVSLHAPNDTLRNQIVPTNDKTGLDAIMAAADDYFAATGRRLTYEYVLLADINDQSEHSHQLCRLLRGREALLNVIPYNPVAGLPYRTPSIATQQAFRRILEQGGVTVRFRHRKGEKIDAACGQLRRSSAATPVGTAPQNVREN